MRHSPDEERAWKLIRRRGEWSPLSGSVAVLIDEGWRARLKYDNYGTYLYRSYNIRS
jgi:hypothetical protein